MSIPEGAKKTTSLVMAYDNFTRYIKSLIPEIEDVKYTYEGIDYITDLDNIEEIVEETISKDIKAEVTSIHIDDCDLAGVWIAYKEKKA